MTATINRLGPRAQARRVHETNQRVGKQIGELREEAGVGQSELARCAGISQAYLWKIEAGIAAPSVAVLVAIGSCLGADLSVRYFPGTGPRITFARSGLAVNWSPDFPSLLELAEACDVPTRYSCRSGVCHTCVTAVIEGVADAVAEFLKLW